MRGVVSPMSLARVRRRQGNAFLSGFSHLHASRARKGQWRHNLSGRPGGAANGGRRRKACDRCPASFQRKHWFFPRQPRPNPPATARILAASHARARMGQPQRYGDGPHTLPPGGGKSKAQGWADRGPAPPSRREKIPAFDFCALRTGPDAHAVASRSRPKSWPVVRGTDVFPAYKKTLP